MQIFAGVASLDEVPSALIGQAIRTGVEARGVAPGSAEFESEVSEASLDLAKRFDSAKKSGGALRVSLSESYERLPANDSPTPERTGAGPVITDRDAESKTDKPRFPGRAHWLRERLRERGWNKHDVARQRGPDPKTVQKVLDGEAVRENVLEKLAEALSRAPLSKKLPAIRLIDIPDR